MGIWLHIGEEQEGVQDDDDGYSFLGQLAGLRPKIVNLIILETWP